MSIAGLAEQLRGARAEARSLDAAAWSGVIASVGNGYEVQSRLASLAGGEVGGWKVTALDVEQQRGYQAAAPVAGALLVPFIHREPATLPLSRFVAPLLECEISFRLAGDFPARVEPYSRAEIEAGIDAIVPAMEIADCRWQAGATDLLKLADDMGNGAFITGRPLSDWRDFDLNAIAVVLTHDGAEIARGSCARILGNPLLAVMALANAQPLPAGGLRRGQIVTTGTCTTPLALRSGMYVADFGPLGRVHLTMQ